MRRLLTGSSCAHCKRWTVNEPHLAEYEMSSCTWPVHFELFSCLLLLPDCCYNWCMWGEESKVSECLVALLSCEILPFFTPAAKYCARAHRLHLNLSWCSWWNNRTIENQSAHSTHTLMMARLFFFQLLYWNKLIWAVKSFSHAAAAAAAAYDYWARAMEKKLFFSLFSLFFLSFFPSPSCCHKPKSCAPNSARTTHTHTSRSHSFQPATTTTTWIHTHFLPSSGSMRQNNKWIQLAKQTLAPNNNANWDGIFSRRAKSERRWIWNELQNSLGF